MQVIGVDIGGTFTDLVLFDQTTGELRVTKVPSRPGAEEEAVLHGLQLLGVEMELRRGPCIAIPSSN